jgi:hypothetical protein
MLLNIKSVFWFSIQLSFKKILILKTIQQDIVKNMSTSSCKVAVIFVGFWQNLDFLDTFSKKRSSFIKLRPVGAELFYTDR